MVRVHNARGTPVLIIKGSMTLRHNSRRHCKRASCMRANSIKPLSLVELQMRVAQQRATATPTTGEFAQCAHTHHNHITTTADTLTLPFAATAKSGRAHTTTRRDRRSMHPSPVVAGRAGRQVVQHVGGRRAEKQAAAQAEERAPALAAIGVCLWMTTMTKTCE